LLLKIAALGRLHQLGTKDELALLELLLD
jgi:hypothetical protein